VQCARDERCTNERPTSFLSSKKKKKKYLVYLPYGYPNG